MFKRALAIQFEINQAFSLMALSGVLPSRSVKKRRRRTWTEPWADRFPVEAPSKSPSQGSKRAVRLSSHNRVTYTAPIAPVLERLVLCRWHGYRQTRLKSIRKAYERFVIVLGGVMSSSTPRHTDTVHTNLIRSSNLRLCCSFNNNAFSHKAMIA
jgi:hypothetical protein